MRIKHEDTQISTTSDCERCGEEKEHHGNFLNFNAYCDHCDLIIRMQEETEEE